MTKNKTQNTCPKLPKQGNKKAGTHIYERKEEKANPTICRSRPGIHIGDYVAIQKIVEGAWKVDAKNGSVTNLLTGFPVAFHKEKNGYLRCSVHMSGFSISIYKHRIIWVAANLPHMLPLNYNLMIDHINGDKEDNRIENLQLVTISENILKGKKISPNHLFSDDEVRKIREEFLEGKNISELARTYDADKTTISRLVRKLSYRRVV